MGRTEKPNTPSMSTHTQNSSTPNLLTYEVNTSPAPLTTSTPGANIAVVIKANPAVYLDEIIIGIPASATSSADTIFLTSPLLTSSLSANSSWQLQQLKPVKHSNTSVSMQEFKLLPKTPDTDQITQDLTFTVTGSTNESVGTGSIVISEHSGSQVDQYAFRSLAHPVTKQGPRPFFLNNLMAYSSKSPDIPKTTFALAEPIELSWASNGGTYTLYQGNIPKPVYSGTKSSFSVTSGVKADTTFVLKATSGNGVLFQTITLQISNPVLTPNSSTIGIAGATQAALTVEGGTTSITGNQFTVNAPTAFTQNLNAGGLIAQEALIGAKGPAPGSVMTVGGQADFQGPLNVTGLTTVKGPLTAAGTAMVTGLSTLNGGLTANCTTTIGGPATLKNGLTVEGSISTSQKSQILYTLSPKTTTLYFKTLSDGFFTLQMDGSAPATGMARMYCAVSYPGDSNPTSPSFNVVCKAGQGPFSQTIPVCAGTQFTFNAGCFLNLPGSLSWVGSALPKNLTPQVLSENVSKNSPLELEMAAVQKQFEEEVQALKTGKEAYARSFIEELQVQFDKELSQEATDLLVTKLLNVERGG